MNLVKKLRHEEQGIALIAALAVTVLMLIIGTAVVSMAMNSEKIVGNDKRESVSQNIAEAGVDDAIAVTMANFWDIFPYGALPSGQGDGTAMFDVPQSLTDSGGGVVGNYQVWAKEDPDRDGNVLLTSIGTLANGETKTVRVSVKYNLHIFDYAIFAGDPNGDYGDGKHDYYNGTKSAKLKFKKDSCSGGNITINGKVHVNGELELKSEEHGNGSVTFNDAVTYTDSYDHSFNPNGVQPVQGDSVTFPTIDFNSSSLTDGAVTLTFNSSGSPPTGWTKSSSTFSISAQNFESRYAGKVVRIKNNCNDCVIKITGSASNPVTITGTIVILPTGITGGSTKSLDKFKIIGPGISMQPLNGMAILSGMGDVRLEEGVNVGVAGAGALIYCAAPVGSSNESEFEMESGGTIFGSVVVGTEEVEFETGHDDHNGQNISVTYDPAFLFKMPHDWWDGGDLTAYKENYEES